MPSGDSLPDLSIDMSIMLPLDPSRRFNVKTDMPHFGHQFATGAIFGSLLVSTEEAVIASVQVTRSLGFRFQNVAKGSNL